MQTTPNTNKNDKLLTPVEVAEILSISVATIYRIMSKRQIRFSKIGGGIRFRREDVEQYIKDNSVEPMIG